jgi:hypothetical protein
MDDENQTSTKKAKAKCWDNLLELRMKNSERTDADRIDIIVAFLQVESENDNCVHHKGGNKLKCNCLSLLQNEKEKKEAVAKYILWFSNQPKTTGQALIMSQIRSAETIKGFKKATDVQNNFGLPFLTDNILVSSELCKIDICQSALMRIAPSWNEMVGNLQEGSHDRQDPPTRFGGKD